MLCDGCVIAYDTRTHPQWLSECLHQERCCSHFIGTALPQVFADLTLTRTLELKIQGIGIPWVFQFNVYTQNAVQHLRFFYLAVRCCMNSDKLLAFKSYFQVSHAKREGKRHSLAWIGKYCHGTATPQSDVLYQSKTLYHTPSTLKELKRQNVHSSGAEIERHKFVCPLTPNPQYMENLIMENLMLCLSPGLFLLAVFLIIKN